MKKSGTHQKSHKSELLDFYINKYVVVTFDDGNKEIGLLKYPKYGTGYLLKCVYYDVRFYKKHLKSIKEFGKI